jgi:hypothetical protein
MSDTLSDTELEGERAELLPARTVLSTFTQGANGGNGANGLDKWGGIGLGIPILDKLFPGSGNAVGGAGESANGS